LEKKLPFLEKLRVFTCYNFYAQVPTWPKSALQTLMGPRPGGPYARSRRGSPVPKAPILTH